MLRSRGTRVSLALVLLSGAWLGWNRVIGAALEGFSYLFPEALAQGHLLQMLLTGRGGIAGTNASDNPKERAESDSLQSY